MRAAEVSEGSSGIRTLRPAARWALALLVAGVALIGSLILVALIVMVLQPPDWVQVVTGTGLVLGAATLAWLLASALAPPPTPASLTVVTSASSDGRRTANELRRA